MAVGQWLHSMLQCTTASCIQQLWCGVVWCGGVGCGVVLIATTPWEGREPLSWLGAVFIRAVMQVGYVYCALIS
jgi:hypothetical protein